MKKHLFFAFTLGALVSLGQAPAIQWEKSLGGTNIEKGNAMQQTADGGYIVAGETSSSDGDVTMNNGTADYWVAKLDSTGALSWQKSLGGSGDDRANAIIQTADGGYLVAGTSNSAGGDITAPKGQYDAWIVKLSATGTVSWQKSLGGTAIDQAWAVQQTTDGGYIIAADSRSNNYDLTANNGSSDFWIIKTDAIGAITWQKSLGGSGTENAYSVQQTADGGYIAAGQTASTGGDVSGNNGGTDYWVVKLTSTGTLQWQKCLGGTSTDIAYSIKQTTDGGFIVAGSAGSNDGNVTGNNGLENAWVVKLSSTGTITWQKCYGGPVYDGANCIQQSSDGGYIFTGAASSNSIDVSGNHGSDDYWVVKLSSTGMLQWQKCLGGSASDVGMAVQETADNGFAVAGRSRSTNGDVTGNKGLDDFWVVKFVGTPVVPTGISEVGTTAAFSVYPNPANGSLILNLDNILLQAGTVQITNVAGQVIYKSEITPSRCSIDLSGKPKGIYFLQLRDESGTLLGTKKLVLN